jgi:hypothetical protein
MDVAIPLANTRGLMRRGVPTEPPPDAPKEEHALGLQDIVNLVSTPELFFSMNPTFESLKPSVDKSLNTLLQAGIIAHAGKKPRRKGGCGGCARRKLYSFAMQFANRFQVVTMAAQKSPESKETLERDLRAYLVRKMDLDPTKPIVFYPRLKNGKVRKVVL